MSKILNILNCQGENVGEYTIPDNVIELKKGGTALHDAVVAIRAGRRAGTACTKTRGLVRGGGAKPCRYRSSKHAALPIRPNTPHVPSFVRARAGK